ncbi:MarR family winged helix-turn-helix transcriptional regulator [Blastococcus sp. PRF04-17]|uniref:MarR family winged helix-turn-helix transcriptional regulator n=1 Tax=Blastococcus sp. PRF04-17 TaxID=2933797 RepID=UPI001FF551A2|nr:MarR family winged helix-turn-helix transcriptional regulator [Blastococcus sp. PRF04-17]UOY00386.1 MarR family winged helix-turn-helix transcriptional regulator [Blastococcus sp. PRF04-17]
MRADDDVLLDLARAVVGLSTRAADKLGSVSVVQLRALSVLRELGTATLRDLAAHMGVTVSTTSRLVDRLVAADLVDRRPSPRSRRELELRIAPTGRATLDRYDELRLSQLRSALLSVPPAERADVLALLGRFAAAVPTAPIEEPTA